MVAGTVGTALLSFSCADFQGGYRGDECKFKPEDAENHLVQSLGEENDQKDAMSALSQERGGDDPFEHPAKTPAFPWRCRMSDLKNLQLSTITAITITSPPDVPSRMAAMAFRTQMMCWQCCRWIVSKWFFHLLAFSFLILHCVALVLVADNATDQPDMWRSSSLRNVLNLWCFQLLLLSLSSSCIFVDKTCLFCSGTFSFLSFSQIQPQDRDLF